MRLALDILISAVFAVVAAVVGLLVGLVLALIISLVFFHGPDAFGFLALILMGFCGFVFGIMGFPLCGIWLNQRRQAAGSQPSAPENA